MPNCILICLGMSDKSKLYGKRQAGQTVTGSNSTRLENLKRILDLKYIGSTNRFLGVFQIKLEKISQGLYNKTDFIFGWLCIN